MNNLIHQDEIKCAVMFADIAGSTQLFDQVGDERAKKAIDQCLVLMIKIIVNNRGTIVKTIGDEVMCRFDSIDDAAHAAVAIQNSLKFNSVSNALSLKVRAGIHYGPAILEKGDIFGDAVNLAARMANIAQANQIIVTEEFARKISVQAGVMTRKFDRVKIKGKRLEMTVFEILWEQQDQTVMLTQNTQLSQNSNRLTLKFKNITKTISNDQSSFSLGRDQSTDLCVNSLLASRVHAVIEYNRGKFVLNDQSTNGTYVRNESGQEIYIRRESFPLTRLGTISLGIAIENNLDHLIEYECAEG